MEGEFSFTVNTTGTTRPSSSPPFRGDPLAEYRRAREGWTRGRIENSL